MLQREVGAACFLLIFDQFLWLHPFILPCNDNNGLMLGHRLRRWPNIKSSLFQSLLFAGYLLSEQILHFAEQYLFIHPLFPRRDVRVNPHQRIDVFRASL